MKANKTLFGIILVFLIVLVSNMAFAEDYFTVNAAEKNLAICSCGQKDIQLAVQNYEAVTAYYTIEKSGTASQLAVINDPSFSLDSGKSKIVDIIVNFDCATVGNYDLRLTVSNDISIQRYVDFTIKTDKCENINIAASQQSLETCAGKDAIFEVAVANPADFTESYKVGSSLYGDKVTFSEASFDLKANEATKLLVKYSPGLNEEGTKKFDLIVAADKNQITGRLPLEVTVNKCNDFDVWLNKNTDRMLACSDAKFGVTVENHAKSANDFDFEVTGPEWIKLAINGSLKISPNDKKTVEVDVKAPCDASGIYSADIAAKVNGVAITKSANLKLIVYPADQAYRLNQPWFMNLYEEYPYQIIAGIIVVLAILTFGIVVIVKRADKKIKEAKEKAKERKMKMLEEAELELKRAEKKKSSLKWIWWVIGVIVVGAAAAATYYVPQLNKFVMSNPLYVVIGMGSLIALFLVIKIIGTLRKSKSAKKHEKEDKKLKEIDTETQKKKDELKQIETHVTKAIQKKQKKPRKFLKAFFIILLIAILGGLGYVFVANNLQEIQTSYNAVVALFTVQPEQAVQPKLEGNLMRIETKNLKFEGNTMIISDQTSIPLVVESKQGKTTFSIQSGVYWMKIFNGNVDVEENQSQVVYLQITPDDKINGKRFNINIKADVKNDLNETSTDSIALDIKIQAPLMGLFESYASYAVLGIVTMLICILMINAGRSSKKEKVVEDDIDWRTRKISELIQEKKEPLNYEIKKDKKLGKKSEDSYADFKLGGRK